MDCALRTSSAIVKDRITTEKFSIPYRVYGSGGPHLVCLNGVQQSMAMWHSFIQRFSDEYRVVVFDFPGQGKGQVLSGPTHISVDDQVDILKEVIKTTQVNNITICSASWGGVVALAYAQKYPQSIHRMLLGGMGTRPNKSMTETIERGCRINSKDRNEMAKVLIKSFGTNLPENMKNRISRQFCTMSKEQLQAFCDQGLFVLSAKNLEDIVDLKSIFVETILIQAENDTIIDLEDVKFLETQLPVCRLRLVKGVGHFLHLESDDVLEVYHEFFPKMNHKTSAPRIYANKHTPHY